MDIFASINSSFLVSNAIVDHKENAHGQVVPLPDVCETDVHLGFFPSISEEKNTTWYTCEQTYLLEHKRQTYLEASDQTYFIHPTKYTTISSLS